MKNKNLIYIHIWRDANTGEQLRPVANHHYYAEGMFYKNREDALDGLLSWAQSFMRQGGKDVMYHCTYVENISTGKVHKLDMRSELIEWVLKKQQPQIYHDVIIGYLGAIHVQQIA